MDEGSGRRTFWPGLKVRLRAVRLYMAFCCGWAWARLLWSRLHSSSSLALIFSTYSMLVCCGSPSLVYACLSLSRAPLT